MVQGKIKKMVRDNGYGFIQADGSGDDIFFHHSSVQGVRFDDLQEGQAVEFSMDDGAAKKGKGPRAGRVTPLAGN